MAPVPDHAPNATRAPAQQRSGWVAPCLAAGTFAALAIAAAVVTNPTPAEAARKVETMPVSQVRPGMRGHAVTVFSGTDTDKFEIEVVDTISNYLPKQDAILFRSTDPRLKHSGIVGGMSGSPVFIGGKLVGAVAYGWRFNKDPLGALTPIANMRNVGNLPYRPDVLPHPRSGRKRRGTAAWADTMLGLQTSALPARRRPNQLDPATDVTPLQVPLSVSGLSSYSARLLGDAFGMTPVRGGSSRGTTKTGKAPGQPNKWDFGDAVAVVLIDGDSSVAGNGTVTWVNPKGDRLLAFGHSMFDDGPTNVPMATSRVHTIISSVERSVKLSSPLQIDGLMYQDRQAAIALRTDLRAPMIPVVTRMVGPDPDLAPRVYENRVAFGIDITPNLLSVILAEAVDEGGRDATELSINLVHEIAIDTSAGPRDVRIVEDMFFAGGVIGRVIGRSRGVATVAAILDNDFEMAKLRGIRHMIRMQYGAPLDEIREVRLREDEIRAGDLVRLEVVMRPWKGQERTRVLPLRIPDDAAGEEVVIKLTGGGFTRPQRPIPGNLEDLITTIEATYPARSMIVSVYRQAEGLSTEHGLMHAVPDSILETIADRGSTHRPVKFKQLARRVIPTKNIIEGEHTLKVAVKPRTSF